MNTKINEIIIIENSELDSQIEIKFRNKKLIFKFLLLFIVLLELHNINFVSANNIINISHDDAVKMVNQNFIPQTKLELNDINNSYSKHILNMFDNALAKEGILEWRLSANRKSIEPYRWNIFIENNGVIVGIICVSPFDGRFMSRVIVDRQYSIPIIPSEMNISIILKNKYVDTTQYVLDETKFVYLGAYLGSFWFVPNKFNFSKSILFDIGYVNFTTIEESLNIIDNRNKLIEPFVNNQTKNVISRISRMEFDRKSDGIETNSKVTWLVGEVPYYWQFDSSWCWAFSLVMQHQWWSPEALGTGLTQAYEVANYFNKDWNQGGSLSDIDRCMREWHQINNQYENYQFVWSGVGNHPIQDGAPTGYTNDIKTWLDYLGSPVIVAGDSDNDFLNLADHVVLVVGYNDDYDVIYINNSGHDVHGASGADAAVSYADFNDFWSGWSVLSPSYSMCGGIPGDNKYTNVANAGIKFSGSITDSEKEKIYDIMIGPGQDNTHSGWDTFQDFYYEDFVRIWLNELSSGETSTPIDKGSFSSYSPSPPNSWIDFKTSGIPKDTTVGGAYFHIKPKVLGNIKINYEWNLYDEDDRTHILNDNERISVRDDRYGTNTWLNMFKTKLIHIIHGPSSQTFNVIDDDTTNPSYSNQGTSPSGTVYDSYSNYIRLQIDWSDSSGINEVKFRYKYGSDTWLGWYSQTGSSGNSYWYDIPRNDWINHLSQTLYWESYATDNDNDRDNDRLTTYTSTFTGPTFADDDTSPPWIGNPSSSGDITETNTNDYKLQVEAIDASGIERLDFEYKFGSSSWSSWILASGYSGNTYWYYIPRSVWITYPGETIYFKALAWDNDLDRGSSDQLYTESSQYTAGTIIDDDTTPPTLSNPTGTLDTATNNYRLQIKVTDVSGINQVLFKYKFDIGSWTEWRTPSGSSSDTYWYLIPQGEWLGHSTVSWQVFAEDNDFDNNIAKDRASTTSPVYENPLPLTYDVTVDAYCLTDGASKSVSFTWDSQPYTTPKAFTGLTGSHTATAPDNCGVSTHTFKEWRKDGAFLSSDKQITISGVGTYTITFARAPAQSATFTEWTIPTSSCDPYGIVVSGSKVYFTEYNGSKIGRLDPSANSIKEWTIPTSDSLTTGITVSGGKVWFAEYGGNKIGRLDPSTNKIMEWTIPSMDTRTWFVTVSSGIVWFTESLGSKIGSLDPSTNTFTEWMVWPVSSCPNGITVSGGMVWFTEYEGNKIGRLNPSTHTFTEWTLPAAGSYPWSMIMSKNGNVWLLELNLEGTTARIGRLNPVTNKLTEWTIPTLFSSPEELTEDAMGNIYFTEWTEDAVGKLKPTGGTTYTLSPMVTFAYSYDSVSSPTTSTVTSTTKTVAPTTTVVAGAATGQFVEWGVPTAGRAPAGLASEDGTTFYLTEFGGNKIAQFKPQNTFTEWTIPTSASVPAAIVVSGGKVYFNEESSHKIGRLDPSTNKIKEWNITTANSSSAQITVSGGKVWFTEIDGNKIGRLDPSTNMLTEWAVPTSVGRPFGITVSGSMVWFAEFDGNKIGRLDPSTNTFTEWTVPTSSSGETSILVSGGVVWFTEFFGNKIGRLDPSTNKITEWTIPTTSSYTHPITIAGGKIYFAEAGGNKIGRLDPSKNAFTEWTIPTVAGQPRGVSIYGGKIWFTEANGNKIGKLFPTGGVVTTVASIAKIVSPAVTTETPTTTSMKPTTSTVTPAQTYVNALTTGQFTEWNIPTSGNFPWGIASPGGGEVWFTELSANKIGLLN